MSTATRDGDWTVRRILEWTTGHLQKHGSESPRLDAEVLLAHARQCKRIALYTNYDELVTDAQRATMRDLVQRRVKHEPVAYLVGHREFFSLDFAVNAAVLIPRPDTETLVVEAIEFAKGYAQPRILDLCTGSGCVAIAIAVNCPAAIVHATDLSTEALEVTRKNIAKHKLTERITLHQGDLFTAIPPDLRFDIIVSNPPYVTTSEMATLPDDIRLHEPKSALDGGTAGRDFVDRIFTEAPRFLMPGGHIAVEMSPEQTAPVAEQVQKQGGLTEVTIRKDLAGQPRLVMARLNS